MASYAMAAFGTPDQVARYLPEMVGGRMLGAYALSEAQAGSDISGITARAKRADRRLRTERRQGVDHPRVEGRLLHRPSPAPATIERAGISCFHVPGNAPGMTFGDAGAQDGPDRVDHHVAVLRRGPRRRGPADRRRRRGSSDRVVRAGLRPARHRGLCDRAGAGGAGLASGGYAKTREQFGRRIAEFQGLQFLLADMAAAVDTSRAGYLMAARKRDAGRFTRDAAVAKLVATDAAMKVTTDAVQVLGGYGYTRDFPAERYLREAKVTQIFEGTNQIQRLVISRQLLR